MKHPLPPRLRFQLAGLSFGGVLVAHWLAYVLAAPDPHARLELLHRTGHSLWPFFVALSLGALMWGASGLVLGLFRSDREGARETASIAACSIRLVAMQATLFVVLEASERLLVEASVTGLWAEPVVLIGLCLQIVVAVAGAGLVAALSVVAHRLRGRPPRRARAMAALGWDTTVNRPPLRPLAETRTARGPPFPLRP
jgi:hypothetical protein